ncbi:unnamed protein product [Ilex paraguariensis]|uniref:Uncharacterized protein n=1 Tax=Ilex paraguariensis TaxID=185542 RepID=A0ABC8RC21_9AQUA
MKKSRPQEERRKIELPQRRTTTFSFDIVDSLCSSEEDSSLGGKEIFSDVTKTGVSTDGLLQISLGSGDRENRSADNAQRQPIEDSKLRCDPDVGPLNDAVVHREWGRALTLHKSLSAKLALPHSPALT